MFDSVSSDGSVSDSGAVDAPRSVDAQPANDAAHADGRPSSDAIDAVTAADVHVGACNDLASPGTWENITPPGVAAQLPPQGPGGPGDGCTYGVGAFAVDPTNPAVVYLGTCEMGVWKTTDCGSTWVHVNTGLNGPALDNGRQWTFVIDPIDPQVIYTNSGYNNWIPSGTWDGNGVSGAFKSTNGGVDWTVMWPPSDPTQANIVGYNFVDQVVLDPTDHTHILLSWHSPCAAPYNQACIGETTDSGATWQFVNGQSTWTGGEETVEVYFLTDRNTWLFESQSNGVWRTSDAGANWTLLDGSAAGHGGGQLYRASSNGVFYLAVTSGVYRSPDGISWMLEPGGSTTGSGLTGDGTTLWTSAGFPWGAQSSPPAYEPFRTSSESDGITWTTMPSPMLTNGGPLAYDAAHHILYSSNEEAGFWRVVTQ